MYSEADGTCWLNISDTYCGTGSKGNCKDPKNPEGRNGQKVSIAQNVEGCKHKDLIGIPWMLAFALRNSGLVSRGMILSGRKGTPCRKVQRTG